MLREFNLKKAVLLIVLLAQNSSLALVISYSRTTGGSKEQYNSTTTILLNELLKFLVCMVLYLAEVEPAHPTRGWSEKMGVFVRAMAQPENLLYVVPTLLYVVQNHIVFHVLGLIDAGLYQVLSNLKVITTALFTVLLLGKSLHRLQWMALVLLAAGVATAQNATVDNTKHTLGEDDAADNYMARTTMGVILMVIMSTISGFSGAFTERMYKKNTAQSLPTTTGAEKAPSPMSFYLKSMIFYFYGTFINCVALLKDRESLYVNGFFYGYNINTWFVVFLLAAGGLLVSLVITTLDNIAKVYVTCISIFLTSFLSYFLFEFHYNVQFVLGLIVVSISVLIYNDPIMSMPALLPQPPEHRNT